MFHVLVNKQEIGKAQENFRSVVYGKASTFSSVTIGYQGGNEPAKVAWLDKAGFWTYFDELPAGKSSGERFWNVFGVGYPSGNVGITCEINPPVTGFNKRVAGIFARDDQGQIAVLHRGRLNGVTKQFVRFNFKGEWVGFRDGDGTTGECLLIGNLSSKDFVERLRSFVLEAQRVKALARAQTLVRRYVPKGRSLSEELIRERREEANHA